MRARARAKRVLSSQDDVPGKLFLTIINELRLVNRAKCQVCFAELSPAASQLNRTRHGPRNPSALTSLSLTVSSGPETRVSSSVVG